MEDELRIESTRITPEVHELVAEQGRRYKAEDALQQFCDPDTYRVWALIKEIDSNPDYGVDDLYEQVEDYLCGHYNEMPAEDFLRDHLAPQLYEKLRSGELVATYSKKLGSERYEIPGEHWNFLQVDLQRDQAYLEDSTNENLETSKAQIIRREVRKFLLIQERTSAPSSRSTSAGTGDSSISAERSCRDWISSEATHGHMWKKQDMLERAKSMFPGLSRRGFERAWAAAAPDTWKRPGKKSSRPNRNGDS